MPARMARISNTHNIMAQLLYRTVSVDFQLRAARRHERLCLKTPGGQDFAGRIHPLIEELKTKQGKVAEAELEEEMARDEVNAADTRLDNAVRAVFKKVEQYDLEHQDAPLLRQVFPDGRFGDIIGTPVEDEPNTVDQLAGRIETLGATHPLHPSAADLRTTAQAVRTALDAHQGKLQLLARAEGEEEIAAANLRAGYAANYHDLCKVHGKRGAERFFPNLASRSVRDEEPVSPAA